ncbi:MAG: SdpI family protein [Firmicutes bacterium]|nr:SdpI family protein [Bacillota bacterium]
MAFWWFMFVVLELMPLSLIVLGRLFMLRPPRKINTRFGYRTPRSMSNQETWDFAHRHAGRLWWVMGWPMLVASAFVMLLFRGGDTESIGRASLALLAAQAVCVLFVFYPTEKALRREFDEQGRRRVK